MSGDTFTGWMSSHGCYSCIELWFFPCNEFFFTALVKTTLINASESVDFGCWGIDEFLHSKVWIVGYFFLVWLCKWICLHFLIWNKVFVVTMAAVGVHAIVFCIVGGNPQASGVLPQPRNPQRLDDSTWYHNQWILPSVSYAFNLFSHYPDFTDNEYIKEEMKLIKETCDEIRNDNNIKIKAMLLGFHYLGCQRWSLLLLWTVPFCLWILGHLHVSAASHPKICYQIFLLQFLLWEERH